MSTMKLYRWQVKGSSLGPWAISLQHNFKDRTDITNKRFFTDSVEEAEQWLLQFVKELNSDFGKYAYGFDKPQPYTHLELRAFEYLVADVRMPDGWDHPGIQAVVKEESVLLRTVALEDLYTTCRLVRALRRVKDWYNGTWTG